MKGIQSSEVMFKNQSIGSKPDNDSYKDIEYSNQQEYESLTLPSSRDVSQCILGPRQVPHTEELRYKTEMCKKWVENNGDCPYGFKCRFAHGHEEVQSKNFINGKYRSKPCFDYHKLLNCVYGDRCMFYHSDREIESRLADQAGSIDRYSKLLMDPKISIS